MKHYHILYGSSVKNHFVSEHLLKETLEDIYKRFNVSSLRYEETVGSFIDLGGPCMVKEPKIETILSNDFKFTIFARDFSYYFDKLDNAKPRKFNNKKEYYKLHGCRDCVVLSPEQRQIILLNWKNHSNEFRELENNSNRIFNQAIDDIKKHGTHFLFQEKIQNVDKKFN